MIARNKIHRSSPRFSLGRVVSTPGALRALEDAGDNISQFLSRHQAGDWGDVCDEDCKENENSLRNGWRLLSSYRTSKGVKVWVITEADRSVTTLLLPEEY